MDTAAVLRGFDDVVAMQCERPETLLKAEGEWPSAHVRPFSLLHASYRELVERGEEAGLLARLPLEEVLHLGGRPAHGGAFTVPKDEVARRWICPNETLNELASDGKLVQLQMPYLPQLRSLTVPAGRKLHAASFMPFGVATVGGASWPCHRCGEEASSSTQR